MSKVILALTLISIIVLQMACAGGAKSGARDVKVKLNQAAVALNTAATTNHSFYEGGVYGPVGSEGAIATRQKIATVIHSANEKLALAVDLAKGLTDATFAAGKIAILGALADAAAQLKTGNQKIDLVLQSVALIINEAVGIIQLFKSADLREVMPEIRNYSLPAFA